MKKRLYILAIAIISLFGFSAFTINEDPFLALLKKLEEFSKKHPQEKVHLHLDKPYYAIGDDIWFKAYIVDGQINAPSNISNILYVELINAKDSIQKQLKLPIINGITWGDFKLTDSLTEGNYRIRAYTQWMRNESPDFFFDKTIKIGNSWANKVFTKTKNVFSTEGNAEKVTTTLQFNNSNGQPYVNNDVSYEIQLSGRTILKGKATTNANGEITIPIVNNQPSIYKSGKINTTITLGNKQKITKSIPLTTTSTTIDVQFFPEGGTFISGLPNKVGIKAVNANGLGQDLSGIIVDDEGNEVVAFATSYLGMGNVILNPVPDKNYKAIITLKNGSEKIINLPKSKKSGYILSISNTDTAKINVKILLTPDLLNKGELKLIAQHNGDIYLNSTIPTSKQIVSVIVPKHKFTSGTVLFTLFSADNLPICERMIFVNNGLDKIDIAIKDLQTSYPTRGKVTLSLQANENEKAAQGSFSIAVTNASAVTPDTENETNIFTSLLLAADLKGYIEKPNHYFLADNAKTRAELDNLLLTQGWRRINWTNLIAEREPIINFEPEKFMRISGKITKNGKPVANGKVSLFSNSGGFFAIDTLSDANGRFSFDQISFGDSTKFVVQARTDRNNKNVQIDLDIVPHQIVTTNKNTGDIEININESLQDYLQQSNKFFNEQVKKGLLNKTIMLDEVKIVETKNQTPNSQNLNGAGRADQVFTAKDLETAFSLSQFLQGRTLGVTIRNGMAYSNRANGGAMNIVLDGMNMGQDFSLDDIVVQDVESVEVLRSIGNIAIYGSNGANGLLVITTKRGGGTSSYNRYSPGVIVYAPKGFYSSREFYSPKYDINPDLKPDLRTTVYWNPNLVADENGKASFEFYNTDVPGLYRMVIEGIDSFGNLGRKVYTYEVK